MSTYVIWADPSFSVTRELFVKCLLIFILQLPHVVSDMLSKDMISVNTGVEFFALCVKTRETAVAVIKKRYIANTQPTTHHNCSYIIESGMSKKQKLRKLPNVSSRFIKSLDIGCRGPRKII